MRASLSLHLSLFRRQKAQIARAVEGSSPAFRAYASRYQRRTRTYRRGLSREQVAAELAAADVIYVGDYHTLRRSQETYLSWVEAAHAWGRPLVLALEFIEGRHQEVLDRYLAGRLSERAFLERIGRSPSSSFDMWLGVEPILRFAREHGLPVVAIDRRARGPGALQKRDRFAALRIAEALGGMPDARVMVLMGQYHVAPCHLPAAVQRTLGARDGRRHLVVYQNCEGVYWRLVRQGVADETFAVELREGELCLINASPVVCQQSFLDYLEAESSDEPLADEGAHARFAEMAGLVARFVGVDVRRALREVEVATAADFDFLERARARAGFTRHELQALKQQVLWRESYYVPRARMAYLATLSVNHAAEEAAHFVRHCCVGEAMEAARTASDTFYARCIEEAIGFFGSKLVNPRRRCWTIADWAQAFRQRRGEDRNIAAFVLAHSAAETEGAEQASKLIPLKQDRLFHAVSHGLGYQLGDALFRAFDAGRMGRAAMRALFKDPLRRPKERYFELRTRSHPFP